MQPAEDAGSWQGSERTQSLAGQRPSLSLHSQAAPVSAGVIFQCISFFEALESTCQGRGKRAPSRTNNSVWFELATDSRD